MLSLKNQNDKILYKKNIYINLYQSKLQQLENIFFNIFYPKGIKLNAYLEKIFIILYTIYMHKIILVHSRVLKLLF